MDKEGIKIGVYLCDCGINIAAKVDVAEVAKFAEKLPEVAVAREYKYMCSDPGQNLIKTDIKNLSLNRIIVASCSPHLHEHTFRKATQEGGLNPFLFQMVSIRELVSWVTEDPKEATEKAKALIAAAVNRVKEHEVLETKEVKVNPDVLIIGGGIAGITASLVLADAGKKVYLVEKQPSIGGHMAKFDKTFPTLDCAACILTPKMTAVKDHPNIHLMAYSEVKEVSGFVGNFKVKIRKKPRYVDEEKCIGCYACVENCIYKKPKFPSEFDEGLGLRKPIYIPFPQAVPLAAVIDPKTCIEFKTHKCEKKCKEACEKISQRFAINFDQKEQEIEIEVGTIIVTTGFKTFDASRISRYGYKKYPNVYTSLEVERLLNASGPTSGEVILRDGSKPRRVGIIHCVGSRDENYNVYCSKVCCMYSMKIAHLVRERTSAQIYNFYIDIRAAGKGYEEFYKKIMDEGTIFMRGKVAEVTDIFESEEEKELGKLVIVVEDTLLGKIKRIPVDMVILAVGLEPQKDAQEIRKLLNISCSAEGWFLEKHPKLAPVSTFTDGVFIAGACQGPKDIPDTVAQAGGAAAEAMALIDRGHVELEPSTAIVDEERCTGCQICMSVCPYAAISFDKGKGVVRVNEALCKGCGSCACACPSKAIAQRLFRDEQILGEMKGILHQGAYSSI
ncbi:Electron transport complex subunit RsxB [Candidatus Methanoperedenaceae archaeon GB37]|nr:Electron transport complex subunit RsxB [Candidatus Methanoperedenaceae archaeon GB37]